MSRVGEKPVAIPPGVTVKVDGATVVVKGPKGELSWAVPKGVRAAVVEGRVELARDDESKEARCRHGLSRSLVSNMVLGVTKGYSRELEIEGVGFKAEVKGGTLTLALGFSHPVTFAVPAGTLVAVAGSVITVSGADKQQVGDIAARIRSFHPPEPYKGKGIRYRGEHVRRKAGKTVA